MNSKQHKQKKRREAKTWLKKGFRLSRVLATGPLPGCSPAFLLPCLLARSLACSLACLLACLLACSLARLLACSLAGLHACIPACLVTCVVTCLPCSGASFRVQVFFGYLFWLFLVFVWFYVRGCCKNCKSHKDETNAEAAIGLFWVFFWVLPSWVIQTVQ